MAVDLIQVQTTVGSVDVANQLADALLDSGLVACIQISSPVTSCYVWDGAVQREEEFVLVAKTTQAAWKDLQDFLMKVHPYQEPQLIALPITHVSDGYLAWASSQVRTNQQGA